MDTSGRMFCILWLIGAASGLQWSEELKAVSGPIQVCSGENIQLLWNFTLDKGERLKGMVWGCQPEGEEEESLATYMDGQFVPVASISGRLAYLHAGSIELSCATILESGNYSIAVSVEDRDDSMSVYRKTVPVNVVDMPKTQSGEIHLTRNPEAVRDVTTGEWHVQLMCGNFSDRGHPAVDVIWTNPQGEQLESSSFEDGFFRLMLPNPVSGGNYSCRVAPAQAAMACLPKASPLWNTEAAEVDETAGRFSVLEARQKELMKQVAADQRHRTDFETDVANRTSVLEQRLGEAVQNLVSQPVSFHARLTRNVQLSSGVTLVLASVLTNQGGGYSAFTGRFTAPANGTYFLIGTTRPNGSYYAKMRLTREGFSVCDIVLYNNDDRSMGSCHAVIYLKAGERVWLESTQSNSHLLAEATFFSGFRVY